MADVQPFRALHYDLSRTGGLQPVAAPPYDVIDADQRAALVARSPYNVVEIDLPRDPDGGDPYAHAAETLRAWREEGVIVRDDEPALWVLEQDYTGPDGRRRTRRGFFARVKVEDYGPGRIRPHERTHPGPKEDRLRLTRATKANLSPIFSLYDDPAGAALPDKPEPYRRLDTAVLEALVLEGALGMTEDDISHLNGLDYARDAAQARERVDAGEAQAAFFMGPTPVERVRDVAATGESMPPKSTYFFPKVLTGMVFNPLDD